jgi:hypothetical protein
MFIRRSCKWRLKIPNRFSIPRAFGTAPIDKTSTASVDLLMTTFDLFRTADVPFDSFHFYRPVPVQILLVSSKTPLITSRKWITCGRKTASS